MFAGTDPNDRTTFIDAVTLSSTGVVVSSTATLTSSLNPSTAGTNVVFTATVTGSAPTGSVAFTADGTTLSGCGAVALPTGTANTKSATCSTASLTAGTHSIVATYSGDAANSGSTSAALGQVVNAAPPASLINASFETPLQHGGFTYNPTGAGIGWTFSPNSGIAGNGSAFGAATAPDGVQVGFVQGASTISQTLSLNAGSYTLSFKASARWSQPQPLKVMVDGVQVGALVAPTSTAWALFSIPLSVATSGAHALAFVGTQALDETTFIDAVTIQ
jgi:hypothetical protein